VRLREDDRLSDTSWLDELRLEPGPPFQTMGTHALDVRNWLLADSARDEQVARKRRLIAEVPELVIATSDASHEAAQEVRELVVAAIGADATGAPPGARAALVDAALMVQEDLVVVQRVGDAWTVTAGVVCFPTHWTIEEKVGRPLAEVHEGVAHYDRELRDRVDRFHDRLTVDRPVWRRNWFVSPTDELHLPVFPPGLVIPDMIEPDGTPMWIRSERQTLRRLPRTDAILFTIRVQLAPLGALRDRLDLAVRMLTAVRSWDAQKRAYTSTGRVLDALEEWLADLTSTR
jgi:hypothetical protein